MQCSYYQARVTRSRAWLLVGIIRSFEHLVFERTVDKESSTFEFFVPKDLEAYFEEIMNYFIAQDIVCDLQKLENRLI